MNIPPFYKYAIIIAVMDEKVHGFFLKKSVSSILETQKVQIAGKFSVLYIKIFSEIFCCL